MKIHRLDDSKRQIFKTNGKINLLLAANYFRRKQSFLYVFAKNIHAADLHKGIHFLKTHGNKIYSQTMGNRWQLLFSSNSFTL